VDSMWRSFGYTGRYVIAVDKKVRFMI